MSFKGALVPIFILLRPVLALSSGFREYLTIYGRTSSKQQNKRKQCSVLRVTVL